MYEDRYGRGTSYRAAGIEVSTFRVEATETFAKERPVTMENLVSAPSMDERAVWFVDRYEAVKSYGADVAGPGFHADGPCLVAGPLHTIVVHAGQSIVMDDAGDFLLNLQS
jgi:N-methylhydantoinase A